MLAKRIPITDVHEAVLAGIEEHALTPEAVEQVVRLTERDEVRDHQDKLLAEQRHNASRIERLVRSIEEGGASKSLRVRLDAIEARQGTIVDELRALRPVPRLPARVVEDRLAEWRRLLRESTTQARAVLQRLLRGRIVFTPGEDGRGWNFTVETRLDRLFAGIVAPRLSWVKVGAAIGSDHITEEGTPEADWGRLLERAYAAANSENWWRPWRDSNPRCGRERAEC